MIPTCPGCGADENTEGSPLSHLSGHGPALDRFYCGRCNLTYTGGQSEWEQMYDRRKLWREDHPDEVVGEQQEADF